MRTHASGLAHVANAKTRPLALTEGRRREVSVHSPSLASDSRSDLWELMLLLASGSARRHATRDRIATLAGSVPLSQLGDELARQRLLALLGPRLAELAPHISGDDFWERVDAARAVQASVGTGLELVTLGVLGVLERARIEALPLKGVLWARALHGDVSLRPSTDVDVLVASEKLEAACAALRTHGFVDEDPPGSLPILHRTLRSPSRAGPWIEVHWRVHWYENAFSRAVLRRAQRNPEGWLEPLPVDELTCLLLFVARDGFSGLRLAVDVVAWWEIVRDTAPDLREVVRVFPGLEASLVGAALMTHRLLGTPDPRALGLRQPTRTVDLSVRLGDWALVADADQHLANVALVDGLLRPPQQTGPFLRRQLTIGAGAPGAHGGLIPDALHAVKRLVRWAYALLRVRSGRWWTPPPTALVP